MYDIFLTEDVRKLVKRKSIVFMGDSNVRAMYKDFLCLLKDSRYIPPRILRNKMETTVYGDELVYHGRKTNGRNYREEREALINSTRVSFYFLTKVYDDYVEDVLEKITRRSQPDVIIMNSCVWDITRWGCDGVSQYKDNLKFLMKKFKRLIPNCLVIWVTTPPLAAEMKGGFLVKELQFLKYSLRFHVVEANHFARKVVVDNGFDVLDTHFHLQMQIHRRSPDGIHWEPKAIRYVTNLILRHISLSWNVPLPHRYESAVVDENLVASGDTKNLKTTKEESKKNTVDVKNVHSKTSVLESSEKLQSMVTVVNKQSPVAVVNKQSTKTVMKKQSPVTVIKKQSPVTVAKNKKKRRGSIQLYKVPKREENIHSHMSRAERKARNKRIRQWNQPILGDSSQSCAPSFGHNSHLRNLTYGKQDQRPPFEADLSNNSFQSNQHNFNPVTSSSYLPHTPVHNSHNSLQRNVPLITSPSQIPLPPYSPDHQQPRDTHRQNEPQLPSFSRSNDFDFPLITSPSQIPLPPYSPGHCQPDGSPIQRSECQLLPFNSSVHFNCPVITSPNQTSSPPYSPYYEQLDNAPPQRRVIDCQTTCWSSSGFTNNGNRAYSQSNFLNRQSSQHNRMFETVNNSVVPHKFPHVIPGQILQPRCDFVNDEVPQVYLF